MTITLYSCVGGGPMSRLAEQLRARGQSAVLKAEMTAMEWRTLSSSGTTGRLRARLRAMVAFPLRAVGHSLGDGGVLAPTTNPFFVPALLVATKALHGRPVVPLIYDLYPDAVIASGHASLSPALVAITKSLNRFLFKHADGAVFIGARMRDHAASAYGRPKKSAVMHTGASLAEFAELREQRDSITTVCGVDVGDRCLISYVGNMGHVHEWDTLRDGLTQLCRAETEKFVVIISASGPGVDFLKRELPPECLKTIHFAAPTDDDEWRRLMVRTDLSLVTLRDAAKHTSVPSKTFSAMAAGAAIIAIAPRASDLGDVVSESGCGAVVTPGNSLHFVDTVLRLLRDPDELERIRSAALWAIENKYDLGLQADRWIEFSNDVASSSRPGLGYQLIKRVVDIAAAGAALGLFAPLLAASAVAVRVTTGSPVLFRQRRPGKDGVPFELLKFRSMRDPAPGEEGPDADGARLTAVGRFLRKTSIDELPALVNVLLGDMSLIGPRPLLVRYLPRYSSRQARRHDVTPGITGLAQVSGRNAISWEEKFEHDIDYVERRGLWLDLKILLRTVGSVFRRSGIAQDGHATMPEFIGSNGAHAADGDAR